MGGRKKGCIERSCRDGKGALMIELVILAVVVTIVILVMQPWKW